MSAEDPARLFVDHLPVIEEVVRAICRRHRLPADEADEFRSVVRLKLVEKDYEILRRFEGRASLRTYLTVVVQRLFLDYRIQQWGKWRPSAEAKRLGPLAVRLEMLTTRDHLPFEEAAETLISQDATVSRDELDSLRARLPGRIVRRLVSEKEAGEVATPNGDAESALLRREREPAARRAREALSRALEGLAAQDRLVLKMRFEDAFPVADIARALHLDQKRLYRRVDQLLGELRRGLEAQGLSRVEIVELLEQPLDIAVSFTGGAGIDAARPSTSRSAAR